MPKVYIPHVAMKVDKSNGQRVAVYDFTEAAFHGQLVEVLPRNVDVSDFRALPYAVKNGLDSFKADDFLLCVGDPIVIALCAGVLLRDLKDLNMLKWDRDTKTYHKVSVTL